MRGTNNNNDVNGIDGNVTTRINNNEAVGSEAIAVGVPWAQFVPIDVERERRQRSVRVWIIFLLLLLFLDDDDGSSTNTDLSHLRGSASDSSTGFQHHQGPVKNALWLEQNSAAALVYRSRRRQDETLWKLASSHHRYKHLMQVNDGKDMKQMIEDWVLEQSEMEKDEFFIPPPARPGGSAAAISTTEVEPLVRQLLQDRNETVAAVVLLSHRLERRDENNLTSTQYDSTLVDMNGKTTTISPTTITTPPPTTTTTATTIAVDSSSSSSSTTTTMPAPIPKVTLTQDSGRVAFQLFSRKIPGMREISIVDGFVKLYDNASTNGYSTRKDMLLRVRGVLIHSIGKLSLVNYHAVDRTALIIGGQEEQDELDDRDPPPDPIRNRVLTNRQTDAMAANATAPIPITPPLLWSEYVVPYPFAHDTALETLRKVRTQAARLMPPREQALEANAAKCDFEINMMVTETEWKVGHWRKLIERRVAEARRLDPTVHDNDGTPVLTTGSNPAENGPPSQPLSVASVAGRGRRRRKLVQDEALVMHMTGIIHSPNCNFTAHLNTTALRTDWDAATGKAIAYSFYMLIVCLLEIALLLRQVLHSQTLATAVRVSLLSVGWHTTIDALLCLVHIYLSLAMSPLFTAFASVAFFKLLIFCVIEMKYMVVIVQARNNSNTSGVGPITAEAFRRQVAILHLRFYVTLMSVFCALFYFVEKYRTASMLLLYSFWVPQIVLNVVTEARTPLNRKYIYGMSITRMIAPFYVYAVRDNFLKEVYPECPTDFLLVLKLAIWVGIQAALLISQEKYGARFMIPARFLPPKFDYSRPLPASMIPPGALDMPAPEQMEDRSERSRVATTKMEPLPTKAAVAGQCRHKTAETTRKRLKANRSNTNNGTMIAEEHHHHPVPAPSSLLPIPTLECSICYDDIDIRDRPNYMLAPCNHLFHRDCLTRWMEAKLECPICRTNLPSL